ncbi:hypothetical protein [Hoylesella saccharolytica]|uniref:hypothetical protein n=1 Tax=Hoylesella saccharolytica TaxID=633701 RepID=UPI000471EFC9|nr:hypothetical protein [Hoylesella saccharolytica]
MTQLDRIEQIHPDLISQFFATGKCEVIPQELQLFLQQLQWAMEIYEHERNITRAARKLRQRITAEQHIKIEERTCMARLYEAINYFSVDNNVPIKIWENQYANQFENLAKMCALAGDYKTQGKCYERALECRRRASEIAEADRDLGVTFIFSPTITAEELGFSKKSLKEIAAKHNEGFYITLIDSLPIERKEKKRLLRDSDIQNAEILQELPND